MTSRSSGLDIVTPLNTVQSSQRITQQADGHSSTLRVGGFITYIIIIINYYREVFGGLSVDLNLYIRTCKKIKSKI